MNVASKTICSLVGHGVEVVTTCEDGNPVSIVNGGRLDGFVVRGNRGDDPLNQHRKLTLLVMEAPSTN